MRVHAESFGLMHRVGKVIGEVVLSDRNRMEFGAHARRHFARFFFFALAAIAFLMAVIRRFSLLPFVVYRIVLGIVILLLINAGLIFA